MELRSLVIPQTKGLGYPGFATLDSGLREHLQGASGAGLTFYLWLASRRRGLVRGCLLQVSEAYVMYQVLSDFAFEL